MSDNVIPLKPKKAIAEVNIQLFDDGSTAVTVPDEFRETISYNQLEEILRTTLDKIYVNRITNAVVTLVSQNKNVQDNISKSDS